MWAIVVAALALGWFLFPPFHIVRLRPDGAPGLMSGGFDAQAAAEKLWPQIMAASTSRAVDAATLGAALQRDPKAAAERFARRMGLGGAAGYFVAGEGRITAVERNALQIETAGSPGSNFTLETGPIFGNALRDATGLVDVSAFANSQDFNALAAALNAIAEERVLPALRARARVGATIRFAGCTEVVDTDGDPLPLRIIPIRAEVLP